MKEKPTLLVVTAHPDDAEIRCYGTLCKYRDEGYKCYVLIASSGENGISLEDKKRFLKNYVEKETRETETKNAFKGSEIEVEILNFEDGNISVNKNLISTIEKKIKDYQPEIVITHYPDNLGIDHQDHTAVGRAVINCASRIESVKRIMLCEPMFTLRAGFIPNCFIDISPYFENKIQALKQHKSQLGRYYLEEDYHLTRSDYYGLSVGLGVGSSGGKFEIFKTIFEMKS